MGAIFGVCTVASPLPPAEELDAAIAILGEYGPVPVRRHPHQGVVFAASAHPWQERSDEAVVTGPDGCVIAADVLLTGDTVGGSPLPENPGGDCAALAAACAAVGSRRLFDVCSGEFALAIWHPTDERLTLGRDVLGTRPLYWWSNGDRCAFATDIRCLLALSWIERRIDEDRVARYLAFPLDRGSQPLIAGIERVLPGTYLEWHRGVVRQHRYWTPEEVREVHFPRLEDYFERARELIGHAVTDRLREPSAVGAHFSGGLDSTTVALLANTHLRGRNRSLAGLYTWSPALDAEFPLMRPYDERPVLQDLARVIDAPLRHLETDQNWLGPFAHSGIIPDFGNWGEERQVIALARADGCGTILSGWCGDELISFNQRGWLGWQLLHGRVLGAARLLQSWVRWARYKQESIPLTLYRQIVPLLPDALYQFVGRKPLVGDADRLWSQNIAQRFRALRSPRPPAWREYALPRTNQLSLIANGHMAGRMDVWARLCAGMGLMHRYPLADRRVVEFALSVPPPVLNAHGTSRGLFRGAFAPLLPKGINKADPANELKRARNREFVEQHVVDALHRGEFIDECPWLDMARLRAQVARLADPSLDRSTKVRLLLTIHPALRVLAAWREASGVTRSPRGEHTPSCGRR